MNMRLPALLGAWIAALVCGGCGMLTSGPAKDTPRQVGPASGGSTKGGLASGGPTIRSAELDELTTGLRRSLRRPALVRLRRLEEG